MSIAAVPGYLQEQDFAQASPGLRFGMYLPIWGVNNRTGEFLWTTSDINYRVAGKKREERRFEDENKTVALNQATRLTGADKELMKSVRARQDALAERLAATGALLTLDARAVAPFTTGLGNEHPLENGFAFLNPYGLPYLPGSGVKGVLRQAARELAGVLDDVQWDLDSEWKKDTINALFGKEDSNDPQRGALSFWDVIPQIAGDHLMVEIMTPHQKHYYQDGEPPHDSGQPNPISFLTVPPGSSFTFRVACDLPFLRRIAPELASDERWKALLTEALQHAFDWCGFGAKTAVGYGAMEHDPEAVEKRAEEEQAREARRREETRQRELEAMTPEQRAHAEAMETIERFRAAVESAKAEPYTPGGPFDQTRNAFIKTVLEWQDPELRRQAGEALDESFSRQWGASKKKLKELKEVVARLTDR